MTGETLYRPADKLAILARIERLKPEQPPLWGKMNAAQMLAHCQVPLLVAIGERRLPRSVLGILVGPLARRTLTRDTPTKRNLPTDKAFAVRDSRDFARERQQLVAVIERVAAAGPTGLSKDPHPFFGRMTQAEWEALNWKHLDHHLRQFGCD
jgi:hypothetical protein